MFSAKILQFNGKRRITAFALVSLTSFFSLFMVSAVSAETCESLYTAENYNEALPLCLSENSYFEVGYIYGQKNDCANMEKYYRLSRTPSAKGNLGIHLLYGQRGCVKDILKGISLLEEAVTAGAQGFSFTIGNNYRNIGNTKLAIEYYSKAIAIKPYDRDWAVNRAQDSYDEIVKLLDANALKDFHLNKILLVNAATASPNVEKLRDTMRNRAMNHLTGVLTIPEKLDLFFNPKLQNTVRCDWGENMYQYAFQELVTSLLSQSNFERFVDNLCDGRKEYFLAKTYEDGLGNKEDFQEAFRLYLRAGEQGNILAKDARDRIRDQLTPEQVAEAVCLADYDIEPAYYQKLLCKF